jgi:hypothetical protein
MTMTMSRVPFVLALLAVLAPAAPAPATDADGMVYEQNSAGMRDDHDYLVEKAPGTRRLLFTGDFAYGPRLALNDTFPKKLGARLAQWTSAPLRWEVINVADRACNVEASVGRIRNIGLAYAPDTVVLVYHMNDAEITVDTELGDGEQTWLRIRDALHGDSDAAETATVQAFLARNGFADDLGLIRRDVPVQHTGYFMGHYLPLFWERVRSSFDEMLLLSKAFELDVVVAILPALDSEWDSYEFDDLHARVAAEAASRGFRVVDFGPIFAEHPNRDLMVEGTGGHPSAAASELVAERLEAELADMYFQPRPR